MRETGEKKDTELSSEETNALARSTKKYKDHHDPEGGVRIRDFTIAGFSLKSYKDSLGGKIPGVYEQAFGFVSSMWENDVSDYEEDTYSVGCVSVTLTWEEKARICASCVNLSYKMTLIMSLKGDPGL